ncbi:prephenate dehydratase [Pseudohongiella spirulinae]|uniref:Prephenate dehydratase n=1 Tax=Pseudohongiella spirulinae TaxID=1249552 RepID=A0A0S2KE74_9GAMM|nr:prephenate dehydratase [Pseudohongiella spirulinae]ALO46287.1 prephenate dehydratase [Pseudohongiella spirulinae]
MQKTDDVIRVAFLGPPGTFSHAAVDRAFSEDGRTLDYHSVASIDDVFLDVEAGQSDFGVVPVENSTEGAVNTTLDCLIDTSLSIVGEVFIPIEHNLLLQPGADMVDVRRIVSHKQSLGQCRLWLRSHYPDIELLDVSSNAEAARLAAEDPSTAAIAGLKAAELYGLNVVVAGIQDRRNNTTRFLTLARVRNTQPSGADKTSIIVYAENKPGSLFRLLEPFDRFQVSLTRLETRPARDDMWSYVFFIDFEGHSDDAAVKQVFSQLTERVVKIKNLGSYTRASS